MFWPAFTVCGSKAGAKGQVFRSNLGPKIFQETIFQWTIGPVDNIVVLR